MTDNLTTLEIVRGRLANGRTIADSDVHKLVAEIDQLRKDNAAILATVTEGWDQARKRQDQVRNLEAERDRMREALRKVRDELGGSGQTHASLLRAFNIAYATLKGMGHE
jgi:septal ring factor EnvC (AmiA/AmiB activator)